MQITILPPDIIKIDGLQLTIDKRDFPTAPTGYQPLRFELIMWTPENADLGIRGRGVMVITNDDPMRDPHTRIFHDPSILAPYVRAFKKEQAARIEAKIRQFSFHRKQA